MRSIATNIYKAFAHDIYSQIGASHDESLQGMLSTPCCYCYGKFPLETQGEGGTLTGTFGREWRQAFA